MNLARMGLYRSGPVLVAAAAAGLALSAPASAQTEVVPVIPAVKPQITEKTITVKHVSIELAADFDQFNRNFTYLLGRYDPSDFELAVKDPKHGFERLKAAAGDQGLMLFQGTNDHGILFATIGQSRKALRYHIGNPQIALKMTSHNISAALYAPLTLLVYQVDQGHIRVEYDRPSSVFGQFGDPDIDKIARMLDIKLDNILYRAAELKPE